MAPSWSRIARTITGAVRWRRSGSQLGSGDGLGQISASEQTTTGTDALEVNMPPSHQRDTLGTGTGDSHAPNCATDGQVGPNRARFPLTVSAITSATLGR
ncbi:hypothetical protein C731_2825 [Mycolicibacterium hassiacum DSM 44199]|uniref:Uncharacterized protein n=1 Tax=Mycolicibacterium hassiacum (strain DSM 44199 / CIP 105218 / JCM 12690 / 3849) TaxID=1122247 RepID=K5BFI1_MYCHD|nr:hypothetical protein C731_2825 [Mycolicibacterium hassiacum DSM 44199]